MAKSGGGFSYNGVATQSCRFHDGDAAYLTRTPGTTGNRRTWTWSGWVKRGADDTAGQQILISAGVSSLFSQLYIYKEGGGTANTGRLTYYEYIAASGTDYGKETKAKAQDRSAWYHCMVAVDTTQAVAANRLKIYLNGVIQTSTGADYGALPENFDTHMNLSGTPMYIAKYTNLAQYYDGYLAEVNHVDGLQLAPSNFGEFNNGIWIPKEPDVSEYGTNGFRLQFAQVGVGTASTTTIGADTSGKTSHLTSAGIVVSDCNMPDSPENNFCTMNTNDTVGGITFTEGNLKLSSVGDNECVRGTMAVSSGKWYWEVRPTIAASFIGVKHMNGYHEIKHWENGQGISYYSSNGNKYAINGGESYGDAYSSGEIIGLALDMDGQTLTYYNEGVSQGAIDFSSRSEYTLLAPAVSAAQNAAAYTMNFGADSTFVGTETATSNADENGHGTFNMAVPTGYLALCTANFPEPTIGPGSAKQANDYFETVLYEGDGSTQDIAVNFKPDFTWIKNRDATDEHQLFDSNRGVTKVIESSTTAAEATNDDTLTAFISSGFSLGDDVTVNTNDESYVAWNWKANGGTATATISESGNNPAASVQANPTAGFSLITYTGTGATGTIAHGLGVVPKWMLIKNRDATDNWAVYYGDNTDYIILNTTAATADSANWWNDTSPTSSVFTVNTDHSVNADGEKYVAYVFAEIEGYSKIGSYKGNGAADGAFVYLGFSPAFVLIKNTADTDNWYLADDVRNTANPIVQILNPNRNAVEYTTGSNKINFTATGFKCIDAASGDTNINNELYVYIAFARSPFKYANAAFST